MIGESYLLGPWWYPLRPVHQSWVRLIVTLSPACGVPSALQSPMAVPVSHTAGTPSSPFNGGVSPRTPPSFIFLF